MKHPHSTLKEQAVIMIALIAIVVYVVILLDRQDAKVLASVQDGHAVLECQFNDGWRTVSPERVKDYWDGRWYFTNGSATRCTLKQANK